LSQGRSSGRRGRGGRRAKGGRYDTLDGFDEGPDDGAVANGVLFLVSTHFERRIDEEERKARRVWGGMGKAERE
jgi:hypothetical protein